VGYRSLPQVTKVTASLPPSGSLSDAFWPTGATRAKKPGLQKTQWRDKVQALPVPTRFNQYVKEQPPVYQRIENG